MFRSFLPRLFRLMHFAVVRFGQGAHIELLKKNEGRSPTMEVVHVLLDD